MKLDDAKIRIPSDSPNIKTPGASRISVFSENRREEIQYISVDKLIPYHNQARRSFDEEEIQRLAKTIKTHGIRQPLTVIASKKSHGIFEVVSGERRLRAAKVADLERVPCMIIHDENKAEEIAIIENIHRQDLSLLELGIAYTNLIQTGICISQVEVAERLGVSRSAVVECMKLCDLPESVKVLIIERKVSNRDFLRQICKCSSEAEMVSMIVKNYSTQTTDLSNKKTQPALSQRRKYVVQVFFDDINLVVNYNKLHLLTAEQRDKLRGELKEILLQL